MPLERGSRVGPYEIVLRIGAGGMGEVYRARDPRLGRDVAVKLLREDAASNREGLKRFISEAKAASALNHPNILTVHEIGETEAGPYIVTELVDGETVRALLEREPLSVERALDIAIQAADGIAKAHEAGIVHRDLKPENLMLTRDGFVKILDFGLAKLVRPDSEIAGGAPAFASTETGIIVGTAGYLSPEQLRGVPVDGRSDVFALGTVLYELIAGSNPFGRETAADMFIAILKEEPKPLDQVKPGILPGLSEAVGKALAKKPEERWTSARHFAAELRRIRQVLASSDSVARISAAAAVRKLPQSRTLWLVAGAAAAAAVALLLFWRPSLGGPQAVAMPAGQLAVAVLPVRDESGDEELSRSGIGKILADAFVQILADVPKVYVVSPIRLDGVAQSLGRPIAETAKDLSLARRVSVKAGATAMLTGSLSRLGKTYVLSANLTELSSDRLRGSFRAQAEGSEHLLQDLTEKISDALRTQLGQPAAAGEKPDLEKVATGSVDAYAHFVRGRDLSSEGKWKEAIPELQKAIQIDPQMAVAWTELGCSYSFFGDDADAEAAQKKAEQLLDHANKKEKRWIQWSAIWIGSGKGDLYCAEGEKYIRDFPDDRDGYFYTGLGHEYLLSDCREALIHYEKAYGLTPNYYPITKAIVDCQLKLSRKDRAVAALKRYVGLPWVSAYGRQQAEWRLKELTPGK